MPTIFSGVENRIAQARERHQELHRTTRQDAAALALSMLAATVSLIALKRR